MNFFTNFSSAGFSALLNIRLNNSVYKYTFDNLTFYGYNSKSFKILSKSLWVGRVSGEKGPE